MDITELFKEILKGPLQKAEEGPENGRNDDWMPSFSGEGEMHLPVLSRDDKIVLGRDPETGEEMAVPADPRGHSLVLGTARTGKSTFLLSQMLQDVYRGDSVVLIDPYGGRGGLSHKFLSHIPEDRWDDVVYINPLTAQDRGRLAKINFLEPRRMKKRLVQETFIESIKKVYPNSRDPELENIFAHSLMLLFDTETIPTIEQVMEVALDRGNARLERMKECTDNEVVQFWRKDFRDMEPRSYTPVVNKICRTMTASSLRPFSQARHSSVDLHERMNSGGIVVAEIPRGRMTEDAFTFFGSILLSRLAQLAMQRGEIPEDERRPVHVYMDEAYDLVTDVLRQNMRGLRRSGVYFTFSSQDIRGYSDVWGEGTIPELTDRTVAFRCGEKTARRVESRFRTWLDRGYHEMQEALTELPNHEFYAAVPAGRSTEVKRARTVNPGLGDKNHDKVIARSLEEHGDMTRARKILERKDDVTVGSPQLSPPKFFVLHYLDEREWDREHNVVEHLRDSRGIGGRDARDAVEKLSRGYIQKDTTVPWDKSKEAEMRNQFLYLAERGKKVLYPVIEVTSIGSAERISMMCQVMWDLRFERQRIVAPVLPRQDSGQPVAITTDVSMESGGGEMVYPDLAIYFDYTPSAWLAGGTAAVEVDTDPKKKAFLEHYRDNRDRIEVPTLLVVPDEDGRAFAQEALKKGGAKVVEELDAKSGLEEVEVVVVDPRDIEHPSAVEAERNPDKRFYRQVEESCEANGLMEEYRRLVK